MDYEELFDKLNDLLKGYHAEREEGRFLDYRSPEELSSILCLNEKDSRGDWGKVFTWIEKYLKYSVKTDHKGYLNRMWVGANLPSMFGEMVAAVSNTSSCTYETAPVSTLMEKHMLSEMINLVGFQKGEGQMTTGSSNANMLAMLAARNEFIETAKNDGLFGQQPLYALVSEDAHYSMAKAANILGIGTRNLKKISVNSEGEMDLAHLEKTLHLLVQEGATPFFVSGTAGTTVRGAYDSIPGLLQLREKYNFWLHIDGAWGGSVLVSEELRKMFMPRVEEVDSITWDFHKMLGASLMCNVFLINHRTHTLGKICSGGDDSYIFHNGGSSGGDDQNEVLDLGSVSLQCGRRVDGLKWFLDWKFYGKEGFAERVEKNLELCRYAEEKIDECEELELVLPRKSFNICFRYIGSSPEKSDHINKDIRKYLYHKGESLVGMAYHANRPFLRLLLVNDEISYPDIDEYLASIIRTGKQLEVEPLCQ